jgi:arsenate reductase (thioredoxin)
MRGQKLFLILGLVSTLLIAACSIGNSRTDAASAQVLFVCEHGNVKSLMAAQYFNEMAQARNLSYRAIARGTALDSDTVPEPIIAGLRDDGFDVSRFSPIAVSSADLKASTYAVVFGGASVSMASGAAFQTWNDVPPASVNYAAARASLKAHIAELVDQIERDGSGPDVLPKQEK